jgi:hypothetical protein
VDAGLKSVSSMLAHREGCPRGQPKEGGIRGVGCMIIEVEAMCTDFTSLGQPVVRAAESAGESGGQRIV